MHPKTTCKEETNPTLDYKRLDKTMHEKIPYTRRLKRTGKDSDWNQYCKHNNDLKKKCISARWQHISSPAEEVLENNPNLFWSYV